MTVSHFIFFGKEIVALARFVARVSNEASCMAWSAVHTVTFGHHVRCLGLYQVLTALTSAL